MKRFFVMIVSPLPCRVKRYCPLALGRSIVLRRYCTRSQTSDAAPATYVHTHARRGLASDLLGYSLSEFAVNEYQLGLEDYKKFVVN